MLILILLLFCLLFTFLLSGLRPVRAASVTFAVFLLIDNSNSLYEMAGIGSDPHLLRIDAARLFISYLGVDDAHVTHQCGIIFFGDTAQVVVPLTPLSDSQRRSEIFALIDEPERMGWTDPLTALRLARQELVDASVGDQPVIVLLTDGKPEAGRPFSEEEQAGYITALRAEGAELAAANTPLFIILLANEATDADPTIQAIWQPLWQQMAEATAPGAFHIARHSQDLPAIYHDIVVALTGNQTAGAVVDAVPVGPEPITHTIAVPEGLAHLTFVVSKSAATVQVTVLRPDGEPLAAGQTGIRYAGQPGQSREEVWAVDAPPPGLWTVVLSGAGEVTVWQDYDLAPTPTPTPEPSLTPSHTSSPLPAITHTSTAAPTATPSQTPAPTLPPSPTMTSTPRAVLAAKPTHFPDHHGLASRGRGPWLLLLLVVVLGGGGSWFWYRRKQLRQPSLSGMIHILGAAVGEGQPAAIDLDMFNKQTLTLGTEPADIPLAGMSGQIHLRQGVPNGEIHTVRLSATVPVYINDVPVLGEQTLQDNDLIAAGKVRLRYQNLRLRQTWQPRSEL